MREIFQGILPAVVIFINGAVSAEPAETANIAALLHGMFDKPGVTLSVSPVVVAGDHAIADWSQGEMGGRAFEIETGAINRRRMRIQRHFENG